MTDTCLRLAMIGCGRRAPAFVRTARAIPRARLVALCDKVAPRVGVLKAEAADAAIREYTDHRRMLADGGFDAVLVVTEPEYQAGLSVEVMEAGFPAFSEVPLGLTLQDCWRVVLASERTGRLYYLGEQVRHSYVMCRWRQMVQEGALGSILFAEGHYIHPMAADRYWRHSETGELLTWEQAARTDKRVKTRMWTIPHPILYGPHEMSPLLKVLDDRVVKVACFSTGSPSKRLREAPFPGQFEEHPMPDMEVALMHTAKAAILRFAGSFSSPISETHWYHLFGTKGEVETRRGSDETGFSYVFDRPVLNNHEYRVPRVRETWQRPADPAQDPLAKAAAATGHGGMDFGPLYDFVRCLLDGASPDIDVYQAADTAAPCILAAQSAEQGGATLDVPDFRPGPNRAKGRSPR